VTEKEIISMSKTKESVVALNMISSKPVTTINFTLPNEGRIWKRKVIIVDSVFYHHIVYIAFAGFG
jgi:hypothetical protein